LIAGSAKCACRAGRAARWRLGLAAALLASAHAALAADAAPLPTDPRPALLTAAAPSAEVVRMTEWIAASDDNAGMPFVIVDKRNARVFGFAGNGGLRGTASALLGLARGDVNPPGIGNRPLSAIGPQDRITAAGRFVAMLGHDLGKADILWVDYASGLSLHRVIRGKPSDQRRRRLMSPIVDDHRISYGCINVPAEFFDRIVRPLFIAKTGIVYVLPETRTLGDVFPGAVSK